MSSQFISYHKAPILHQGVNVQLSDIISHWTQQRAKGKETKMWIMGKLHHGRISNDIITFIHIRSGLITVRLAL